MLKKFRIFDHTKLEVFQNMKNQDPRALVGGPSREPRQDTTSTTMIGAKAVIKGDVSGEEDLRIEGNFEGTANLPSNNVIVGQTGQVTADITAKIVTLEGDIKGEIKGVEKVIISKTGRIHGNIWSPRVILEEGAQFTGRIDMNPTDVEKGTTARKVLVKGASAEKPDDSASKRS